MRRGVRVLGLLPLLLLLAACPLAARAFCDSYIYCQGPLLETIQSARLFPDSKSFVDMPTTVSQSQVYEAFLSLPDHDNDTLAAFVSKYFLPAGSEVRSVLPDDWTNHPKFLDGVADPVLRAWGEVVHAKWQNLLRTFDHNPNCSDCYSSIPVPYPFVIAGGRFVEYYYWDSYWIVQGLLISEMTNTTRGVLLNYLSLVDLFGFMPNGGRVYYLNRSQPPMLTQMVDEYFAVTNDMDLLRRALPTLDHEYQFWMTNRSVWLRDSSNNWHVLNNFNVSNVMPRPESYAIDYALAASLPPEQRPALWGNLATGAETGWDFSSRWFADGANLTTIIARDILPVDLNSIMYMNELSLSRFHRLLGNTSLAEYYDVQAQARLAAMNVWLWDADDAMWSDWNLQTNARTARFYPSNLFPLWAGAYDPAAFNATTIARLLQRTTSLFAYAAGVPTSTTHSGQQWDFPNAWAPLELVLVEALLGLNSTGAQQVALQLVNRWIATVYCGWNNTGGNNSGMMFEKYDATQVGAPGGGGEYVVQDGFGWTNGVALRLLQQFGASLQAPAACPPLTHAQWVERSDRTTPHLVWLHADADADADGLPL